MSSTTASHPCQNMIEAKLLNNRGCRLMESQNYNEAIKLLMAALKLAKSKAEDQNTRRQSSSSPNESQTTSSNEANGSLPQHFSPLELDRIMVDDDSSSPIGPYMYRTPVFIQDMFGEESVATVSFVVMFNMALSHHLKGMSTSENQEAPKALEIAKRLYELTFQMQAEEVQSNLILTSAMLNNLSIVHTSLGNEHQASQCEQLLLSTLLLLLDVGGAPPETEPALNGFMDNVMHLIVTQSSAACAA